LEYHYVQIWRVTFVPFATNLKYIKSIVGFSNYQLAKELECSQSSVKNWIDGGNIPHKKTRQKIAEHFGITLAELDGDELPVLPPEGAKKAPATDGEGISAAKRALINAIDGLTDEQCEKLLPIVLSAKTVL
jgi:transcriptional regulator with XRE-family HTH domain